MGEHVVNLAAVVRLVVEEMCHQEVDGILVGLPRVVEVPDRPAEEPFGQAGGENFYAFVVELPRAA